MNNEYRVFGPPGCGKTYYISKQVNLALEKYTPNQIAIVSFSRSAGRTIKSRVTDIPDYNIGTIHSIGRRLCGNLPLAESKVSEFAEKYPEYDMKNINKDDSKLEFNTKSQTDYYSIYNQDRIRMKKHILPGVIGFAEKWNKWKDENDYIDFTDMIEKPYIDGLFMPEIRILFVDEAQDLSPLQFALIRSWGEKMDRFILVGDDDQTIYEWAGADSDKLINPILPSDKIKILSQSYRVPIELQKLAVSISGRIQHRQIKEYKPRDYAGQIINLNCDFKNTSKVNELCVKSITENKHIMILASCKYMLRPLMAGLKQAGIPYGNRYAADRPEFNPISYKSKRGSVTLLERYLRFKHSNINESWVALESVTKMLSASIFIGKGVKKQIEVSAKTQIKLKYETDSALNDILKSIIKPEYYNDFINRNVEFLRNFSIKQYKERLEYLCKVEKNFPDLDFRDSNVFNVTIGTIHSVKGGEADSVVTYPDLSLDGYKEYTKGADSVHRLFYVAVTRSLDKLYLCSPNSSNYYRI